MHIVCPHCTTSYAIDLSTLGAAGRTVRCSRCKEVWLARPEDAIEVMASVPATATAGQQADEQDAAAEWEALAREDNAEEHETPVVDSPSISADWPESNGASETEADWPAAARYDSEDAQAIHPLRLLSKLRNLLNPKALVRIPRKSRVNLPFANLPTACAAMGALVLALIIWRADVVRLMPQTATFYRMVGLDVNLRGLMFKDVKITRETVEGKPVLVIEGVIVGETHKPVELPRLRFSVRDAQGAEIYAWNAVLEQPVLQPGERAWFKSRLASPPPEGRNIDVRFFNKRDVAGGSA
ncbi:MJ0042-type zinc finger domain-containing protein [Bradyrhizobium canariense]|uniref:MJ0042 family finger-like domain-containing protein n=1 Tax=Bradyrhizobium canariense TaxID=255045 RepID=A0A1H1XE97_9BRAD|nr:MJ0042-type zinc finger domain-containing protein [Bradyrhizobium canariense]SDT06976.1 MJ0042 family finger-like domain-containing protein [Bradyrhizobium canariense]